MSAQTHLTAALATQTAAELNELTDNSSGDVTAAVAARRIRHQLLADDLRRHEEEHGAFTEEELAQAHARIFGPRPPGTHA
ncbi:hypothetical protein [Allostreptomyces psammosilenae]|uniref:Uncharacterized protein n=1 Tax=Allostreptomyces psammosilenae TaxID=1892865 RepID=A0A853AAN3_9ACTN|nr:hypothetical protein [Allostreptomyces psammosilenae]NYI07681.1 hypothetical protein [Allostreptomyces psammosilenae]